MRTPERGTSVGVRGLSGEDLSSTDNDISLSYISIRIYEYTFLYEIKYNSCYYKPNQRTIEQMNSQERLDLKKLVDNSDAEDNTATIRRIKHSANFLEDIRVMEQLKRSHVELRSSSPEEFAELCRSKCHFTFNYYTDIFNKQLKDELNLGIMIRMLQVLKLIEDEKVDQHEGSVIVGKFLKELYVDSALRRADNLDKEHANDNAEAPVVEPKKISWKEWKGVGEPMVPPNPLL